jgi:hypothetical protein
VAPNLWAGGLLLAAALAAPASAQRPVDVGAVRARIDSVQKSKGDSGAKAVASSTSAAPVGATPVRPTAPAVKAPAPKAPAAKPAGRPEDAPAADSLKDPGQVEVMRESFAYGGATRDPFASLIKTAHAGPELADLQLVGIYEDLRYSGNSVALLREKTTGKRHKLRAGDAIGRLKVAQVRSKDVVFTVSDFGYERQETLSLRKQEDVTP